MYKKALKILIVFILFGLPISSPSVFAEGKAYFWCLSIHTGEKKDTSYYSKPFLASIDGKAKYEQAFHVFIQAHYVQARFKGTAECFSAAVLGETKRLRDESSLLKREQGFRIAFTDWSY